MSYEYTFKEVIALETESFNFKEILNKIEEWINLDVINPDDIPSIELYMDQVTTFMDKELSGTKRHEDDKILTKTMINNYSKNDLLPPSDKKKYSKDHIILFIYYLKNFLSINDIQALLKPMTEYHFGKSDTDKSTEKSSITMSDIYSDIYRIEEKYKVKLKDSIAEVCEIADREFSKDSEYLKTFAMISMLSYDIYAKKQLIERLIDSIDYKEDNNLESGKTPSDKAAIKKAKEQRKQMEKEAKAKSKQKQSREN